ncbi:hypothetical protein, partial [Cyanothece sp. BG0011]|uniref:hypothetical protein n=1 Tax=Cyanothece sp. BG0011 TaxID=2082950 RepID=UPI0013007B39
MSTLTFKSAATALAITATTIAFAPQQAQAFSIGDTLNITGMADFSLDPDPLSAADGNNVIDFIGGEVESDSTGEFGIRYYSPSTINPPANLFKRQVSVSDVVLSHVSGNTYLGSASNPLITFF